MRRLLAAVGVLVGIGAGGAVGACGTLTVDDDPPDSAPKDGAPLPGTDGGAGDAGALCPLGASIFTFDGHDAPFGTTGKQEHGGLLSFGLVGDKGTFFLATRTEEEGSAAYVSIDLPPLPSRIAFDFDVKIDRPVDTTTSPYPVFVSCKDSPTTAALVIDAQGLYLSVEPSGDGGVDDAYFGFDDAAKWVSMSLVLEGSTATLTSPSRPGGVVARTMSTFTGLPDCTLRLGIESDDGDDFAASASFARACIR